MVNGHNGRNRKSHHRRNEVTHPVIDKISLHEDISDNPVEEKKD